MSETRIVKAECCGHWTKEENISSNRYVTRVENIVHTGDGASWEKKDVPVKLCKKCEADL